MENYLERGTYAVKITGFNKVKTRSGKTVIKVELETILGPHNKPVNATIYDYIKVTNYGRLLELEKSFIDFDFSDIQHIIGCQGIISYNLGYINYLDIAEIAEAEGIEL